MVWYENVMYRKIYVVWYDCVLSYTVAGYHTRQSMVYFGRTGKIKNIKKVRESEETSWFQPH